MKFHRDYRKTSTSVQKNRKKNKKSMITIIMKEKREQERRGQYIEQSDEDLRHIFTFLCHKRSA